MAERGGGWFDTFLSRNVSSSDSVDVVIPLEPLKVGEQKLFSKGEGFLLVHWDKSCQDKNLTGNYYLMKFEGYLKLVPKVLFGSSARRLSYEQAEIYAGGPEALKRLIST